MSEWSSEWEKLIEANIEKICIDSKNKEINLYVERYFETKSKQIIKAQGVRDFLFEDTTLVNMIDRANYYDSNNFDADKIAEALFYLLYRRKSKGADFQAPLFLKELNAIHCGELVFLDIEPLYGGYITILAQSIEMSESF